MARQKINVIYKTRSIYDLADTLEETIAEFTKINNEMKEKGYFDTHFCIDVDWEYGESSYRAEFSGARLETDGEMQKRLDKQKKELEKKKKATLSKLQRVEKQAKAIGYTLVKEEK